MRNDVFSAWRMLHPEYESTNETFVHTLLSFITHLDSHSRCPDDGLEYLFDEQILFSAVYWIMFIRSDQDWMESLAKLVGMQPGHSSWTFCQSWFTALSGGVSRRGGTLLHKISRFEVQRRKERLELGMAMLICIPEDSSSTDVLDS